MTTDDTFGTTLSTWLHEEGVHRVPDHLGEVLVRTVATRQRPWWSSLERWLHVDTTTSFRGRASGTRPILWFAVLLALILAVMGAVIFTGYLRAPTPITGLATNGRIIVVDGGSLRSLAADGTDPRLLASVPAGAVDVAISPDGRRVAYGAPDTPHVLVVGVEGGTPVEIPLPAGTVAVAQMAWSPSGDRLLFAAADSSGESLLVAPADGSATAREVAPGSTTDLAVWWPAWSPDGRWISFVGGRPGSDSGSVYVMHPDGTEVHALPTPPVAIGEFGGGRWSPDASVDQLLYVGAGSTIRLFDVSSGIDHGFAPGFWPTWSPDGDRISYWSDGTRVASTADVLADDDRSTAVFGAFTGVCGDHPELAGKAFCGPAIWSPDGTRLVALDITGSSVLSLLADGKGSPIVFPLAAKGDGNAGQVAWQPIRP